MKLDGTITVGNLITAGAALVSIAIGWGMLTARMDASDMRVAAQSLQFSQAIARIDESLKEQRIDTKALQQSVNALGTDTALIRGRLSSNDATTTRK